MCIRTDYSFIFEENADDNIIFENQFNQLNPIGDTNVNCFVD
jgi:hypothetical protein